MSSPTNAGSTARRLRAWGWGWESRHVDPALMARFEKMLGTVFGDAPLTATTGRGSAAAPGSGAPGAHDAAVLLPSQWASVALPPPRVALPPALEHVDAAALGVATAAPDSDIATDSGSGGSTSKAAAQAIKLASNYERLRCAYGMSLRDVLRGYAGDFSAAPDAVLLPACEEDLTAVLSWCEESRVAAMTRGGGTSVCAGFEAPSGRVGSTDEGGEPMYRGSVVVDMRRFDKLLTVDKTSMLARVQAGMLGPDLEAQLGKHGLTLRHFPQSFEHSSVGGWVATRAGGHFATGATHIDDMVHSLRVVTPRGVIDTPRVPASGAGPDPKRLFIGCEGALGIVTEVVLRVQRRPKYRCSATVTFDDGFLAGAGAVRAICQSGLKPSNCRLVSAMECLAMGLGDGSKAVLLLGFESTDVDDFAPQMRLALRLCKAHRGAREGRRSGDDADDTPPTVRGSTGERDGSAGQWRNSFINAPYLRDELAQRGVIVETFETAVSWASFDAFYAGVSAAVQGAFDKLCGGRGVLTCRLTHAYPDGAAPYFTVVCANPGGGVKAALHRWDAIKAAASGAILALGGTCTHHHAVGRDHRPFYEAEVGDLYLRTLASAKAALDPAWVLNPGVLIPERLRDEATGSKRVLRARL